MASFIAGRNAAWTKRSKPRFTHSEGRSYQRRFRRPSSAWRMWLGSTRKHSARLAASTMQTTVGMSSTIRPKRPPSASMPEKASSVVTAEENTGAAIRRAAVSAAETGERPRRRARWSACSPTTMASSTTMPSVRISPKRETMLIETPSAHIPPAAASSAVGIPAATHSAVRALRNRNSTATTSASPKSALSSSSDSRSWMLSASVLTKAISTPAGRVGRISSATAWATANWRRVSPVSPRLMRITAAGSPWT